MYTYTWYQWLTFFYLYCFFGWIFESTYVSLKQKQFVNRGFLRLPMLPLYGSGAVMMLWVSLPFQDSLILTYISGVIGATALEYVTGYVMERLFKIRYWDYSNQPFNDAPDPQAHRAGCPRDAALLGSVFCIFCDCALCLRFHHLHKGSSCLWKVPGSYAEAPCGA